VMGRVNYAGGTVAVNSVQAQLTPDLIFAATGIPFTLGTNALNTVFTDPFGRSTNRETSVVVSQKAYQYDANGNLTNDGRMAYFWNDENRLVAVRSAKTGALIQENRYDGLGRRRERIQSAVAGGDDPGSTNRYIYQDWLVLAVTDGAGNVLETYTHGADLSGQVGGGAGGIGGILASTQAGGAACYHYDFNGNVVNVSSSNQSQLAKYTYSPFGEVLLKEGSFDSRYQFSTKELDGSTGMNYYGYRFYSPGLGRWVNRDPIGERGGINLYEAMLNNSVRYIDFQGLKVCIDWAAYDKCMELPEDALRECEQIAQENLKLCNQGVEDAFNWCMEECDKIKTTSLRLLCKASCVGIKMQYAGCEMAYLSSIGLCTTLYGYAAAGCLAGATYTVPDECPCDR
jgi:RHS repeat-associated protein